MGISQSRITRGLERAACFLQKHIGILAWIVGGLFLFSLFTQGIAKGGRWDLYEAIAMADQLSGQFGYSQGSIDWFKPSTPYFPGVSFLAALTRTFGGYQVEMLLFAASACVVFLLYLLFFLYRSGGGSWPLARFFVFSVAVSYFFLPSWLDYAKEFKPDAISLVFFVAGSLALLKLERGVNRAVLVVSLLAISLLFKQQIVAPMFGLSLVSFLKHGSYFEKIKDFTYICLGGILGLGIAISVEGGLFYAVLSHVGRGRVSVVDKEHLQLFLEVFGVVFFALAVLGFNSFKERLAALVSNGAVLLIPAIFWFLACFSGAMNYGGNIGNTAVGMVLFIPAAAMFYQKINPVVISGLAVVLICLISTDVATSHWLEEYRERLSLDAEVAEKVADYKPESILVSGDSYISVRNLEVGRISEIDTWAHIHQGVNRKEVAPDGGSLIDFLKPDAIVCVQGCSVFEKDYSFRPLDHGYREERIVSGGRDKVLFFRSDLTSAAHQ